MSKKRYFDTKFWSDTWIVDELNPLDRYLFMYLMLNEKTNIAGVYELPIRTMAYELGLEQSEVQRMIKRLEPRVYYKTGWVVLVNAIKHQNYKNKFIAEGIRTELCKAPAALLELVQLPTDLNIDLSCPIEDSSGHLQDSRVIESNLNRIKSKSKSNAARAVDKKLAAKEQAARTRRASDKTVSSVREQLAKKGIIKTQVK